MDEKGWPPPFRAWIVSRLWRLGRDDEAPKENRMRRGGRPGRVADHDDKAEETLEEKRRKRFAGA